MMDRPDILLITVDALRADRFNEETMYSLWKRLYDSEHAIAYTQVVAACSFTTPSMVSMMTGLFPPAHGVRHLTGEVLSEDVEVLPWLLERLGYVTGAIVGIEPLKHCGLDAHFNHYEGTSNPFATRATEGYYTGKLYSRVRRVWREFKEQNPDKPLFYWVHNADAHEPWMTSYDEAISFIDYETNTLVEDLDPDVVIVTSDHGESLGERGQFHIEGGKHGDALFDEELLVPLIVFSKAPEKVIGLVWEEKVVSDTMISLIDVASLIVAFAGHSYGAWQQGALGYFDHGRRWAYAETTHPRTHFDVQPLRTIRSASTKYVERWDGEDLTKYDLVGDPQERRPMQVVDRHERTDVTNAFGDITRWEEVHEAKDLEMPPEEEEQVKEHLRDLGYID